MSCWGYNRYGQLGDNSTENSEYPTLIPSLSGVLSSTVGDYHTCALLDDNSVSCWGRNYYGQLGNGNSGGSCCEFNGNFDSAVPVSVIGLDSVVSIEAGDDHTCALLHDETVKCWGYNSSGQLGDGTTSKRDTPTQTLSLTSVHSITAGSRHTCALLTDKKTVKCWGNNSYGQLGDDTSKWYTGTPVTVVGL